MCASPIYPLCTVPCATDPLRKISKNERNDTCTRKRDFCAKSLSLEHGSPLQLDIHFAVYVNHLVNKLHFRRRLSPNHRLHKQSHGTGQLCGSQSPNIRQMRSGDPFCVLQVCLMVSKWRPLKSSCLTSTSLFLQRVTSCSSLWTR